MTTQPFADLRCTVCGTAVAPDARRCPDCGLARPAARGRHVLVRGGFVLLGVILVCVWLVTLAVVAAAR